MNPVLVNVPILYPLKTTENQREYKMETSARNGFNSQHNLFTKNIILFSPTLLISILGYQRQRAREKKLQHQFPYIATHWNLKLTEHDPSEECLSYIIFVLDKLHLHFFWNFASNTCNYKI